MATKKPVQAATAKAKPQLLAKGKPSKPTIESVIAERDKFHNWWHEGFKEQKRQEKKIKELRSALSAIALIAKAAEQAGQFDDDDIPF
ncbi:hypothetical protein MAUB1S_09668 [Mycolicibacterium aubagnense]